ncbi:MAG: 50S ribosomal protein L6 [Candidatus Marinimicrobia bacterium]|nr:50S ribosomal protein L6 [Candidatus Neomarinimicrobiota bacterium]MCF7827487.1 50S ribosomal protein L6 [Candidatus Neomarinimicrobiota bacterium]MCF7882383.1 50S ribosomal protein L6 [Candidatus Neomarinimicrobiota bacterium]
MSRIGKQPVVIPEKVDVSFQAPVLTAKGPLGELEITVHADMEVKISDGEVIVTRPSDSKFHRSLHGMTRAIIQNTVDGVKDGYDKSLEIQGVGYTVQRKSDQKILLNLGYSHPILFEAPDGITLDVPDNTHITVKGPNKQLVGQVAAKIRSFRPPEPYKGKGIRYVGEYVRRKAGKAIAAK